MNSISAGPNIRIIHNGFHLQRYKNCYLAADKNERMVAYLKQGIYQFLLIVIINAQ